jgi:hypothetical protein
MSPVADNPVVVPDRDLQKEKTHDPSEPRIRCPLCGWSAQRGQMVLHCAMSGTPSTRETSARLACISGLKRGASHAVDGRRIRIGMCSNEAAGAMDSKKAVIR